MKIRLIRYTELFRALTSKKCALCMIDLPTESNVSICSECMKCADCCVGLEKL